MRLTDEEIRDLASECYEEMMTMGGGSDTIARTIQRALKAAEAAYVLPNPGASMNDVLG